MIQLTSLMAKLAKDERGMESVEVALSIALIAAIAGFGMVVLGDALANFFEEAGTTFAPGSDMPSQGLSNFLP